MEESGEPDTDGSEMLMTSAVAVFLSRSSGDTICSDHLFDGLEHRLLVVVGFLSSNSHGRGPPCLHYSLKLPLPFSGLCCPLLYWSRVSWCAGLYSCR